MPGLTRHHSFSGIEKVLVVGYYTFFCVSYAELKVGKLYQNDRNLRRTGSRQWCRISYVVSHLEHLSVPGSLTIVAHILYASDTHRMLCADAAASSKSKYE